MFGESRAAAFGGAFPARLQRGSPLELLLIQQPATCCRRRGQTGIVCSGLAAMLSWWGAAAASTLFPQGHRDVSFTRRETLA